MRKLCPKCNKYRVLTRFHKNSRAPDGLHIYCVFCRNEHARDYALLRYQRKRTVELEIEKLPSIGNRKRCEICKELSTDRRLCRDHDHKTGKHRGFLCVRCNTGLGMFKDNIEILATAIEYLSLK